MGLAAVRFESQDRADRWRYLVLLTFSVLAFPVFWHGWGGMDEGDGLWVALAIVTCAWVGLEGWSMAAGRQATAGTYLASAGMFEGAVFAAFLTGRSAWSAAAGWPAGVVEGLRWAILLVLGVLLARVFQLGSRAAASRAWSDAMLAALAPLAVGSWALRLSAPATPPDLFVAVWLIYTLGLGTALFATGLRDRQLPRVAAGLAYLVVLGVAHASSRSGALFLPTLVALGLAGILLHRWARRRIEPNAPRGWGIPSSTEIRRLSAQVEEQTRRVEALGSASDRADPAK